MNNLVYNHNIFPTLVQTYPNVLKVEECEYICDVVSKQQMDKHASLSGNALSSFHLNIKNQDSILQSFDSVQKKIIECIDRYREYYGINNLRLDNSWVNVQKPGSSLKFHTHSMSVLSGALYLKIDEQSNGLFFENPNPHSGFVEYYNNNNKITPYNTKYSEIKPQTGDLVIFPSWLKHGSDQINLSPERVVLSFNTKYLLKDVI